MAIVKMKYVETKCSKEHYKEMLLTGAYSQYLSAETASAWIDIENGDKSLPDVTLYADSMNQLKTLCHSVGLKIEKKTELRKFSPQEITDILKLLDEQFKVVNEENSNLSLNEDDQQAIEKMREVGFKEIASCQYLSFGLGRLPKDSLAKLELLDQKNFTLVELHHTQQYYWLAYVTSNTYVKETRHTLENLFYEEIKLPRFDVREIIENQKDLINTLYTFLDYRHELVKLYRYVGIRDDQYILAGFVPSAKVDTYKALFNKVEGVSFNVLDTKETDINPPTLLKNNWFTRPFEMFVNMYSLPGYYDLDPTAFVCITYCILFGIMFGDLGQGALLFAGGFYLEHKKKNRLAGIVGRAGIASMVFGFLFGSVFGNEEILNPIHQSLFGVREKLFHVMSSDATMVLLLGAVAIGAVLILITMIINIRLHLKRRSYGEMFFGHNGLTGFIFYGYLATAMAGMMVFGYDILTLPFLIPCAIVPCLIFLLKEPLVSLVNGHGFRPHHSWGGYILEAVFEVLEILLSFVTNSMSYLRVGGFVLSHAGMMLVVMTLAEMTGGAGWFVVIVGNLFVMMLEGLIVGIQTLRLEYYEMFSRYFEGGGRAFNLISKDI